MKALMMSALVIAVIPLAGCASGGRGMAQGEPSPTLRAASEAHASSGRAPYHYEVITDPAEEGSQFLHLAPDTEP